jgi:hypothetical protein
MPRVGFEPTMTVFERAKTVHALDHATTVISGNCTSTHKLLTVFKQDAQIKGKKSHSKNNIKMDEYYVFRTLIFSITNIRVHRQIQFKIV